MASPESGYALLFNEGPGYLFVAHLGKIGFGEASLVRSCAFPHDLYVRKHVSWQENWSGNPVGHEEVRNHRQLKHTPELIDWTSYSETCYSLTARFCNGGTLSSLLSSLKEPLPELFVWKILSQLFETLTFLQCRCLPPIAHADLYPRNVFLHWTEDSSSDRDGSDKQLPDVFLGDFDISVAGTNVLGCRYDLYCLQLLVLQLCFGGNRSDEAMLGWKKMLPRFYSAELLRSIDLLSMPEGWLDQDGWPSFAVPSAAELWQEFQPLAQSKMAELQSQGESMDLGFPRPIYPKEVRIETSKDGFNGVSLAGPTFLATIDRETLVVLEVEAKDRAEMKPRACGVGAPREDC